MTWEADLYQGDRLAARLARAGKGIVLEFDEEFLANPGQFPRYLSTTIPYRDTPATYPDFPSFFLNLLPEGARLTMLLNASRQARDDVLGLLLRIGRDLVGDLALTPHDVSLKEAETKAGPPTDSADFWATFHDAYGEKALDTAIPGVQEKLSSLTISMPVQSKTWPAAILKLNPQHLPLLVQNEAFFLRMAKDCGLEAALATLHQDQQGAWGLYVRRFDRLKIARRANQKFHQEDGCQLCDEPPGNKYHIAFRDIVDQIQRVASSPMNETLRALQLYAFSYLIGNGDLHAKNISLLWRDGVVKLTPAYDLLSTLPYKGLDQNMAMKLDGRDTNFKPQNFIDFGLRYRVRAQATEAMLHRMLVKVPTWLGNLKEVGFDEGTTDKVCTEIELRAKRLGM